MWKISAIKLFPFQYNFFRRYGKYFWNSIEMVTKLSWESFIYYLGNIYYFLWEFSSET